MQPTTSKPLKWFCTYTVFAKVIQPQGRRKCIWSSLQDYVAQSMALHTRYPGHSGHKPVPGSPLGRVIEIVDSTMGRCNSTACLPQQAVPLVAYQGADNNPLPLRSSPAAGRPRQVEWDNVLGSHAHEGTQAADTEQLPRSSQHSGFGSWLADSLAWTKAGADATGHDAEAAVPGHHAAQRAHHHGSKWIAATGDQQ